MRLVHNVFEPKASRIIRCLLVNVGKEWTVRELAEEAHISVGYTHAVTVTLTEKGYVTRNKNHKLTLLNPATLLRRWAAFHEYSHVNSFLEYYTFDREIETFVNRLGEKLKNQRYALTSLAGAWLISPYVRPIDVHLYVKNEKMSEKICQLLDIKPTAGIGNVRMVIPYDEGVFYGAQPIDGINVVSKVQLFVDLLNYPARGEDAAQHLYGLIEEQWRKTLTGAAHVR